MTILVLELVEDKIVSKRIEHQTSSQAEPLIFKYRLTKNMTTFYSFQNNNFPGICTFKVPEKNTIISFKFRGKR